MVDSATEQQKTLRLRLTGMGRLGEALAAVAQADGDAKQVYVFGGLPGEEVVAEVIRERRGYVAARVVEVIEPSPDRVAPPCPYFGPCTGCQWQHIAYDRQLELKRGIVADALARIGGLDGVAVEPTMPSPRQLGYRNHARFTVSREGSSFRRGSRPAPLGTGRLGFMGRESRAHVAVDACLLMTEPINKLLTALQGRVQETTQVSIRASERTGSWMVQPTLQSPDVPIASGQPHYDDMLGGAVFRVASPSFFQVNAEQSDRVAELVREALALQGTETVVDAYAGVGTFAVLLAPHARRVIAIEDSVPAVEDTRRNAAGLPNVDYRQGRTEDILGEVAAEGPGIDAVVLDPPRTGCAPGTLEALIAAAPARVAYVSCDPESLARDLKVITAGPFHIERVQPVDMFPQTHHVECVVTLSRDKARGASLVGRQRLVLASASPRRREIFTRLGLAHETADAEFPEPPASAGQAAETLAIERALGKARAAAADEALGTVVGVDTVVEVDGEVLGKPRDGDEATAMLRRLRGREHRVVTSVALVDAATGDEVHSHRASRVRMREYGDDEIAAYVASGDPMDKAGAYAVQSAGFAPAAEVRGCYLNVVGLPVCTLAKLADAFGVRLAIDAGDAWPELARCPDCAKAAARSGGT